MSKHPASIICLALGALALGCLAAPQPAAAHPDMIVRTDILEHQWVVRTRSSTPTPAA